MSATQGEIKELIGRPRTKNMILFSYSGGGRGGEHGNEPCSLTTGSEGGTRASGDARRLRKIRSFPPSFTARRDFL